MDNESIKYANKFSVVSNTSKSEFILSFYQSVPKLDANYNVTSVETESVGTFVMNREMFSSLCSQLIHSLNDDLSDDESKTEKYG